MTTSGVDRRAALDVRRRRCASPSLALASPHLRRRLDAFGCLRPRPDGPGRHGTAVPCWRSTPAKLGMNEGTPRRGSWPWATASDGGPGGGRSPMSRSELRACDRSSSTWVLGVAVGSAPFPADRRGRRPPRPSLPPVGGHHMAGHRRFVGRRRMRLQGHGQLWGDLRA